MLVFLGSNWVLLGFVRDQPVPFEHILLKNRIRFRPSKTFRHSLRSERAGTPPGTIFLMPFGDVVVFFLACILRWNLRLELNTISSVRWNRHRISEYLKQRFHKLNNLDGCKLVILIFEKGELSSKPCFCENIYPEKQILEFFYSWVFVSVFFLDPNKNPPPEVFLGKSTQKIQAQVRLPHSRRDNHKTSKKMGLKLPGIRNL